MKAEPGDTSERFWEAFYGDKSAHWSGKANALLVEEVADLPPGTALDLGSGEGGDAIWLAERGWSVTAVDVSANAIARATAHAEAAGVDRAIAWERHDLEVSFPNGSFDLVSACFLHSPVEIPRGQILRRAAAAVAPGGRLLVVGHGGFPSWRRHDPDDEVHLPTPGEVLADLDLPPGEWIVRRSDEATSVLTAPDGTPGTRVDNVLTVERVRAP